MSPKGCNLRLHENCLTVSRPSGTLKPRIDMTLGENLQRLRKEKELSQEDVARALFVTRQTISK